MIRLSICLFFLLTVSVIQAQDVFSDAPAKPEPQNVDMPFRITSLMKGLEGDIKVGVVNDTSGDWKTLNPDESFLGHTLLTVNYEDEYADFDQDGEVTRMFLWGGNIKPETPTESLPLPDNPSYEVKLNPAPMTYTQTAKELAMGINPNDPDTWSEDYRGPAIERLADSVERQKSLFNEPKPLNFEPTEDEIERGINPNDPISWPKDYRGPGIERAAQNQTLIKSTTPFLLPAPPEGTPEEIKQRFLELHTKPIDAPMEE